jgi:hypothetical protein
MSGPGSLGPLVAALMLLGAAVVWIAWRRPPRSDVIRGIARIVGAAVGFLWVAVLIYVFPSGSFGAFGVLLALVAVAGIVVWWRTGRDAIKAGAVGFVLGDLAALLLWAGSG